MSHFSAGVIPKLVVLLLLSVSAVSVGGSGFAQTLNSDPQQSTASFTLSGSSSSSSSAPSIPITPAYISVLTVSAGSGGTVGGTPSGPSYAAGTDISITATPNSGYLFSSWTINGASCNDGSSSSPCAFTMPPNDVNVTANFQPIAETATFSPTSITTTTSTTNVTTTSNNMEAIIVTSNPTSSDEISVDGFTIATPQTYLWTISSEHYLGAPTSLPGINCGGCEYSFLYWLSTSGYEQDQNAFHYTVPPHPETVTAFYSLQTSTATSTTSATSAAATPTVTVSSTTTSQVATPDFSLTTSPPSVWLPPWDFAGTTSFTLTLSSLQGWEGLVQFSTSALPSDVTTSNLPQSYQLSSGETASWNVQVNIGAGAQAGSYQLVISALSGPLVHSAVVTVNVNSSSAFRISPTRDVACGGVFSKRGRNS